MRKGRYIVLLIMMGSLPARPQSNPKDSLLKLLQTAKEDTGKVQLLVELADAVRNSSPKEARSYLDQIPALQKRLNYDPGWWRYYNSYGETYRIEGRYDSTLYYMEQALQATRRIKDSAYIGTALFNLGIAYRDKGEWPKAIEYCLQGLAIMERRGLKDREAEVNDALCSLYAAMNRTDIAIPYGKKALSLARLTTKRPLIARCLINLARAYETGNNHAPAMPLLEEAYTLSVALKDPRLTATTLSNLADASLTRHDYAATIGFEEKILALWQSIGSLDGEATATRGLATCYLQLGKYALARQYAQRSYTIDTANKYKDELAPLLLIMSDIEYATGNRDKGFDLTKECSLTLESMVADIVSKNSTELEKKYETEKKQYRISQLEADKQLQRLELKQKTITNYILIGSAILLLVLLTLLFSNFRQKRALQQQRISELETERQLHITEAILKGEEQERARLAKDLHDGLGGMLSGIKYGFNNMKGNLILTPETAQAFERSMDMLDSSIREMRRVAHNMMPEALVKFGLDAALRDFCNDINGSGALSITYQSMGLDNPTTTPPTTTSTATATPISQTTAITIYRIVQELINNTLKHSGAKTAIVQAALSDNNLLSITVEDDGKGFDTSILKSSTGIGWSSISNRIEFLKGKWDVQSTPGKGTSVLIEIPLAHVN